MSIHPPTESARNNQYSQDAGCDHCSGVTSHEPWCITCNALVSYAYGILSDGGHLTQGDELILHALGVEWNSEGCTRH